MALIAGALRTSSVFVIAYVILNNVFVSSFNNELPYVHTVREVNVTKGDGGLTNVVFEFTGDGLTADLKVKLSDISCDADNAADILGDVLWADGKVARIRATFEVEVVSRTWFLCVLVGDKWVLQDDNSEETFLVRNTRNASSMSLPDYDGLRITGLRVEESEREPSLSVIGTPELLAGVKSAIRIFGQGITENTVISFTHEAREFGGPCLLPATGVFQVEKGSVAETSARVNVVMPESDKPSFYICAKTVISTTDGSITLEEAQADPSPFVHQGSEPWLQIDTYTKLLPLIPRLLIIFLCLCFSALFSGLNLGLLALDRTDLKILCNTGTEREKRFARKIKPVRDHGNYLLCSLLLGNVLVNSTFTILLDDLTSGLVAVAGSTIIIVLFGEITPQAICSRHGLAVGAYTIHITKVVMVITAPLSWPMSKLLDYLLGEEIGNVYNRERLKELVKVTTDINDLDKDEVNIISGALELRKKTVAEVMTHIEDVFMLDIDARLDFETVSDIMKSGYSRVPVYQGSRSNIVTMLYIKDLAFVDPDDKTPLKTLCQFYQNACNFVFEDTTLDVMFKQFKEGHKGHMAFVHRVNNEGYGDPFYETIGLITMEDVIEELIQAEIMDETDVFMDNRSKKRRVHATGHVKQDFTVFADRNERMRISPQLTLATFQYLATSVDAFKADLISTTTLRRLLKQDIIHHIKVKSKEKDRDESSAVIYEQGKPADFFVLILEGRVEVKVGREKITFESGPFTYFGTQALEQAMGGESNSVKGSLESLNREAVMRHTFVPDYTVRAISDVVYLSVKRPLYLAAKRATLMERTQKDGNADVDDEVEKLMHSLDEEDEDTAEINKPVAESSPVVFNGPVSTNPVTQSAFRVNNAPQNTNATDAEAETHQDEGTALLNARNELKMLDHQRY